MGLYPGTLVGCTHLYRSVVYSGRPVFTGKVFSLVKESQQGVMTCASNRYTVSSPGVWYMYGPVFD